MSKKTDDRGAKDLDNPVSSTLVFKLLKDYENIASPELALEIVEEFRRQYSYAIPEAAHLFDISTKDMQRFMADPRFLPKAHVRRIVGIIRRQVSSVGTKYYIARDYERQADENSSKHSVRTGWVRLEKPDIVSSAEELHDAMEAFMRLWQRSRFRSVSGYGLDEEYRAHLIADCEILLAMLREGNVEHGLLRGVRHRIKAAGIAATLMLNVASGAAGGVAGVFAEGLLDDDDRAQATECGYLAELVERRLQGLEEKLPYGPEDGRTPTEEAAERALRGPVGRQT